MDIFETTRIKLSNQGLRIDRYDLNRPWGGFFRVRRKSGPSVC